MEVKYKYYLYWPSSMSIYGPLSFKEAIREREKAAHTIILKMVVDEQGREVK